MTSLETKCVKRYFLRGCAGGRGVLARALDYAALRLMILFAAFLFFRQRIEGMLYVLLLTVLTLLLAMVLLRIMRTLRLERYTQRELMRIKKMLLAQRLALIGRDALLSLARPLSPELLPALIISVEPVSADALLPYAKNAPAAVCAPAGYTPAAAAFAKQVQLTLIPKSALLAEAEKAGYMPDTAAAITYICGEEEQRLEKRKKLGGLPFSEGSSKKYLLTALLLFGLSFLSRYALYYRLLATLCMSIFSVNFLMDRTRAPKADIE